MRMRNGFDTDDLIGRQNREDEEGEAPEEFVMRESPYTVLESVGVGLVSLTISLFIFFYPKIEIGDSVGWLGTILGIALLLVAIPLALYRVRVDRIGLHIGYGTMTTKTILWSDVRSVKVIRTDGGRTGKRIKPHWVVKEMGLYGENGCLFHCSHTLKGLTYLVRAAARLELPAEEVERFSLKDMTKG